MDLDQLEIKVGCENFLEDDRLSFVMEEGSWRRRRLHHAAADAHKLFKESGSTFDGVGRRLPLEQVGSSHREVCGA